MHLLIQGVSEVEAATVTTADWMQAWGSVVSAAVSVILLVQVAFLWYQLRQTKEQLVETAKWNRLNAAFTYFQSDVILQKERAAVEALSAVGYDLLDAAEPLTGPQLKALKADVTKFYPVKDLLNVAEDFATAVHIGAIDEDAAFGMMAILITKWERFLRPVIDERRNANGSAAVYCEVEKLARSWRRRLDRQDRGAVSHLAGSGRGISQAV